MSRWFSSESALGRRFWTLWAATSTTNLADGLTLTAFPLLAVQLTDDARLVALVSVARILPFLVVGLPLGLLVDRFDRRHIVIVSQAVRGSAIALLTVLVATDGATIGILIAAAFVVGLGEVLTDGASPALVRSVVRTEQLEVANARIAAAQTVTNLFIGPPLGAALFVAADWLPFSVIVATLLSAGALMAGLPGRYRAPREESEEESILGQITLGLRYVWGHDVLRPLALAVAVFATVGEAGDAIFVILVTDRFGLGELGFGLLLSVDALVSIVASFFVARLVMGIGHAGSMSLSVVLYGIGTLFYGLGTHVGFAVLAAVLMGTSNPMWNVVSSTIRQRLVPDHLFGRMMTAYLFIAWGAMPLGGILGGLVAEQWGAEWVFLLTTPAMALLYTGARPMFRAVTRTMRGDSDPEDP